MRIKKSDVMFYTGSVHIEKIDKREDVERLYRLSDDMTILGWNLDVCDYDYLNILCIQTNTDILIRYGEMDIFIVNLVKCINNILKE